jgi:hypothetical protein
MLTNRFVQWRSIDSLHLNAAAQFHSGYAHRVKLEYSAVNAMNGIRLIWNSDGMHGNIMKR